MSQVHYPPGLPGVKTEEQAVHRRVLAGGDAVTLPGGIVLDGSESADPLNTGDVRVLRAGILLGKVTANDFYAPSIIGVTNAAYDDSTLETTLNVSAATAVEIVRREGATGSFTIAGPPSAAGTVATETVTYSAVNTTTGAITITGLNADYISGSLILPDDGSQTPLGLLPDGQGVKVTDADGDAIDVPANLLIGGLIAKDGPINWPTDTSLLTYLKGLLNGGDGTVAFRGAFTFAEDYNA